MGVVVALLQRTHHIHIDGCRHTCTCIRFLYIHTRTHAGARTRFLGATPPGSPGALLGKASCTTNFGLGAFGGSRCFPRPSGIFFQKGNCYSRRRAVAEHAVDPRWAEPLAPCMLQASCSFCKCNPCCKCLTGNRVASEEVVLEAPIRVAVAQKG